MSGIVMCHGHSTRLNQYEADLWPRTLGSTSTSVRNVWKQLLDEVRATRHEVRMLREQQKKDTLILQKLQENTVTISKELEKMQEKTFAVQGRDFQVRIYTLHNYIIYIWDNGLMFNIYSSSLTGR